MSVAEKAARGRTRASFIAALCGTAALFTACSRGPTAPAPLDTRNDQCAWCRMSVTDARFAAQLVAPAEEPLFFDDIGCLRDYLVSARDRLPKRAVAYVADHRTRSWATAAGATYSHCPALPTPMDSHLLAHLDAGSRDADPAAAGCRALTVAEVFPSVTPPSGGSR